MMARKRTRIATSVYRDQYGISAIVIVRGHREELRFPIGTSLNTIRQDMATRRMVLDTVVPEGPARGTLEQLVESYLTSLPDGAYKNERRQLLAAWTAHLGDEPFRSITGAALKDVLAAWHRDGTSPSRQNKRISALRVVWARIAPDHALPHPIERLNRLREPKPDLDRSLDLALIERVLARVSDVGVAPFGTKRTAPSLARARLRCLLWTGQPASILELVQPEHVRWKTTPPELYVQPRRKGAGVDAAWIPLLPQAAQALKDLFRIKAHGGQWHRGVLRLAWRRAAKHVAAELVKEKRPDDAARLRRSRPYDLRHSLGTELAKASEDIYVVAEYLRHSDPRTSWRYVKGASSARMRAGIQKLRETIG